MKAIKVILIILVVLGLVAAAGVWGLTRYLEQPEVRQKLTSLASHATGTEVRLEDLKVSIFRGIELRGVTIGNPDGFAGNLLTAKAFVLRYRLWPLVRKRVVVDAIVLETPTIELVKNAQGQWNFERLSGRAEKVQAGASHEPATGGLEVTLHSIRMNHATTTMRTAAGRELLKVQDASFRSGLVVSEGKVSGDGHANIGLVECAHALFLRELSTPVALTPASVKLSPLVGKVAGGEITGAAGMSLVDSRYTVDLHVKNADVVTLFKEANVLPVFSSGKLQLNSSLTGTGGVETVVGAGQAEITGGQLMNVPLLNVVATLLQVSALQNLKFDEFKLEYTLSNNVVQTPVIRIVSPQVKLTGQGELTLADNKLNHTFTLTLAAGTLDHAPKEIRQEFTRNTDGSAAIEFKVWGPYDSPKTDLQKRILQGVGEQLLKKFLK